MTESTGDAPGYMRRSLTLIFDALERPWKGLQAKDRCKPLTPLGRRVLRAHLQAQTAPPQPIEIED
jgi:hypothetical protein